MRKMDKNLTHQQLQALIATSKTFGRFWKSQVRLWWETGNYHSLVPDTDRASLQQVRNKFGPNWLKGFKLPGKD